jgi:hypothetical protein
MPIRSAWPALALLAVLAVSAPVGAQTIEERAAQVRRTLATPPPIETVIDRGTRVLGQPAVAAAVSAVAPQIDPRLLNNAIAPAAFEAIGATHPRPAGGTPGLTPNPTPRGAAFVNDSRGTAVRGSPEITGGVGVRGAVPGLTVIRQPGDDQVTGTANLVTGTGRTPSLAP